MAARQSNFMLTSPICDNWEEPDAQLTDEDIRNKLEAFDVNKRFQYVNLSNQSLRDLPHLVNYSQFHFVERLLLRNNQITLMQPLYLPVNIVKLDLSGNNLQSVPGLMHLTSLKHLFLSRNQISHIVGLPESLDFISLEDNPLTSLMQHCFPHNKLYNELYRSLSTEQLLALHEPPPEIFKQGFHNIKQYFAAFNNSDSITAQLLKYTRKVVVMGDGGAGKTSLCNGLLYGNSLVETKPDPTLVVNILKWITKDGVTFQLFDLGGQQIYDITSRLFISGQYIAIICHNITNNSGQSVNRTITTAFDVLRKRLENKVYFVLTHTDLLSTEECLKREQQFKNAFEKKLEFEQNAIDKLHGKQEKDKTLQYIKKGYDCHKKSINTFLVSNVTYDGVVNIRPKLVEDVLMHKVVIPQRWIRCYQMLFEDQDKNFWLFNDLLIKFKQMCNMYESVVEFCQHKESLVTYLHYLHNTGHILWFDENEELQKIIFHRFEYVVNIFMGLVRHDLEDHIDYTNSTQLKLAYAPEEFKQAMTQFRKAGVLSHDLMKTLWEYSKLVDTTNEVHVSAFVELLKTTDVMYDLDLDKDDAISDQQTPSVRKSWFQNFRPRVKKRNLSTNDIPLDVFKGLDKYYYIPWLVSRNNNPKTLQDIYKPKMNKVTFNLVCQFPGGIPRSFFECMCVRVMKNAMSATLSRFNGQTAWIDGLHVNLGVMKVLMQRCDDKIYIFISSTVHEIPTMWETLENLVREIQSLLQSFSACAYHMFIYCPHCLLHNYNEAMTVDVRRVFATTFSKGNMVFYCTNEDGIPLPGALVHPTAQGNKKAIESVNRYFLDQYSEIPVNERLSQIHKDWLSQHKTVFCDIIDVDDVIHDLAKYLTPNQREIIHKKEGAREKADYLFQIILKGSNAMLKSLTSSLSESSCHSNKLLAYFMPTDCENQQIPDATINELLSIEEKEQIVNATKVVMENIKFINLIPKLRTAGILDRRLNDELQARSTQNSKCVYLVNNVLLRGTFETLQIFKSCLVETNQKAIADQLPSRSIVEVYNKL